MEFFRKLGFKKQPTNPRTIFAVVGFGYGLVLAMVGLYFFSDGRGTSLFLNFAVAPFGLGFFCWPLTWSFIPVLNASPSRTRFLLLIGLHYVGLLYSVSRDVVEQYDAVRLAVQDVLWLALLSTGVYLAGQVFLWQRFLRSESRRKLLT